MPSIPLNLGTIAVKDHVFIPHRQHAGISVEGDDVRLNPAIKLDDAWSGLLVIGLTSQDETETFRVSDVTRIVRRVREQQSGDPSASFLSQKGIYRHKDGKRVVEEDGVRVIVLNLSGASARAFRGEMIALAEIIAKELNQETVILEMQHRGISNGVYLVTA